MLIRDLKIEDMCTLSDLYYQFWSEISNLEKMKKKFAQLMNNPAYIFLVAAEKDQIVGSVMGIVCEELYGECQPFLVVEDMVVDSKFRKKGIGKSLFLELENRAKEKGCTQIILITEADRKGACSLYESLGFHPTMNKGYKKKI